MKKHIFPIIITGYVIFSIWLIFNDPDCRQVTFDGTYFWYSFRDAVVRFLEVLGC